MSNLESFKDSLEFRVQGIAERGIVIESFDEFSLPVTYKASAGSFPDFVPHWSICVQFLGPLIWLWPVNFLLLAMEFRDGSRGG